jgi:putative nucleotidyltransferase with HDIG domain
MLHRIQPDQLEIGMFVHSIDGSWLRHAFWRPRFMIADVDQLQRLVASDVEWVTIDDLRGKPPPATSPPEVPGEPHRATAVAVCPVGSPPPRSPVARILANREVDKGRLSPRERAAELRRASGVVKRSKAAVMTMFEDARLGKAVKSTKLIPLVDQIASSMDRDPSAILNIAKLKTKDEYTYLHSVAVCALMINLARQLNLNEDLIHDIGMAGLLHDVGKMGIPQAILLKPGKLDDSEFDTMRSHPEIGHRILASSKGISDLALDVCLRHHEKMDGTGYPGRMTGDTLSLFSRMSAICDVYDAVTSQRPYNQPWSGARALAKMQTWTGHFDKLILNAFTDSLGIYPSGTLVRLSSGALGVVVAESPKDLTCPIVCILKSSGAGLHEAGPELDLGLAHLSVIAIEDPLDLGFTDWPATAAALVADISPR